MTEPGQANAARDDDGRGHRPSRPSWDCLACEQPWPCDPAREELTGHLDGDALAIFAWVHLEEAAGELPPTPAGELFDRFLKWTRRDPPLDPRTVFWADSPERGAGPTTQIHDGTR